MTIVLRIAGLLLGVTFVIAGVNIASEYGSNNIAAITGMLMIIQGIFVFCLSEIVSKIYDELEEIKNDNLKYVEDLLVYTKNQVKSITVLINENNNK